MVCSLQGVFWTLHLLQWTLWIVSPTVIVPRRAIADRVCSGGYTTTNGKVRNGRVFDVDLKEIRKEYPTVKTYSSCERMSRGPGVQAG
jgi:hypothetical protein